MDGKAARARVVIQTVSPEIDCGRFPIKRIVGDKVIVEADIFCDGHDELRCLLLFAKESDKNWPGQMAMSPLGNDRWRGEFTVTEPGVYRYTIQAWIDRFASWRRDLHKRLQAGQDVAVELLIGGKLVEEASKRAKGADAARLKDWARTLLTNTPLETKIRLAQDDELAGLVQVYAEPRFATLYDKKLSVQVDPERARFSSWYELFPRSWGPKGKHGTFRDLENKLPYLAKMGFDVLYLPPIHPIGRTFRKGKNNSTTCEAGDPGSPWGIGAKEGGHKAIHPELGTMKDFQRLLAKARELHMDIALDIALQCAPDHPYVKEHPEWFRHRPDGTIQYAENPPKKYQDIVPIDFESEKWAELWDEIKSIFFFWMDQGVRIFRVDNPHTKPFSFWEWLIAEVKGKHPEVIFLSEAFTRPKVMYRLAKLGFTQSYTYFTWRNNKTELERYFTELTQTEVREFFRPNLWPNTPDILHAFLQQGGRPAFRIRLVLAAMLGASYGIYGPAFDLGVNEPFQPGSEEYKNSEKYEIKSWDLDSPTSLKDLIARLNQIRKDNPALHADRNLRFHPVDNSELICFSKHTDDLSNVILVVVNLSPNQQQSGWLDWPLEEFKLGPAQGYPVHDLLTDAHYVWNGSHNFIQLDPAHMPAHIFCIRRKKENQPGAPATG
jgi:starch synthase (maltosyl-transferring)